MAFPDPLRIEPAQLVIEDAKVVDALTGDWYFQDDGLSETHYVYLEGSGLLDRLRANDDLVLGEIGFGTGLSYALVQQAAREIGYTGRLSYFGVELRPLSQKQADLANGLRPAALRWLPPCAEPRAGFLQASPDLLLLHGEATDALSRLSAEVDIWFLDGFAPAKNPEAWTDALFTQIARLSRPGAQLSTFTAASDVRRGLERSGFDVKKRKGWGPKREHLTAQWPGTWHPRAKASGALNIAGSGVAGLVLAQQAQRLGFEPVVHGTGQTPVGSAVPFALVNYRPSGDLGPLGHSRKAAFFHLEGYHADARFGVDSIVKDAKLQRRWNEEQDVAHQWTGDDRVHLPHALWVDTQAFRARVLSTVETKDAPLATAQGLTVWANGNDAPLQGLKPNRGQQDEVHLAQPLTHPINFGRLLLPQLQPQRAWAGASFDRQPPEDWHLVRDDDRDETLRRIHEALPGLGAEPTGKSWVGLRATTPDHLPLAGWDNPQLGYLTGLGSKGYLYAPISAKALLADLLGLPSPMENWVWHCLRPHRFAEEE